MRINEPVTSVCEYLGLEMRQQVRSDPAAVFKKDERYGLPPKKTRRS